MSDKDAFVIKDKYKTIGSYEPGNWQCYLFGGQEGNGFLYRPDKRNIPSWFWRKMQYLCFGNRWVKIVGDSGIAFYSNTDSSGVGVTPPTVELQIKYDGSLRGPGTVCPKSKLHIKQAPVVEVDPFCYKCGNFHSHPTAMCNYDNRKQPVEVKKIYDATLLWFEPMTSKQAAHYLMTKGFVAVELYEETKRQVDVSHNAGLDAAIVAVNKQKTYHFNLGNTIADIRTSALTDFIDRDYLIAAISALKKGG